MIEEVDRREWMGGGPGGGGMEWDGMEWVEAMRQASHHPSRLLAGWMHRCTCLCVCVGRCFPTFPPPSNWHCLEVEGVTGWMRL